MAVLRTFNTLMIACNMCNQPLEALAVFSQLQAGGHVPDATSCNVLIAAYGKVRVLDSAWGFTKRVCWHQHDRGRLWLGCHSLLPLLPSQVQTVIKALSKAASIPVLCFRRAVGRY